jgi:hypothetical protein
VKRSIVFTATLAAGAAIMPGEAQPPYGPDACRGGYVWREAFPGDHVCVGVRTRDQAADDNWQTSARRDPGGAPYGPHTCRQGYVWREARPGDHVCVSPETRAQTASDNRQAAARRGPPVDPAIQAKCRRYARRAVDQYQIVANRPKCRVKPDARWQGNYQNHYSWCLSAQNAWIRSEEKARDDRLYRCGGQIRFD